jgi:hypothetical protein
LVEGSRDYSHYSVKQGILEFVTPNENQKIVQLPYDITGDDVERTRELIHIVGQKIRSFDFVDVSHYEPNLNGIIAFEDDLLAGRI